MGYDEQANLYTQITGTTTGSKTTGTTIDPNTAPYNISEQELRRIVGQYENGIQDQEDVDTSDMVKDLISIGYEKQKDGSYEMTMNFKVKITQNEIVQSVVNNNKVIFKDKINNLLTTLKSKLLGHKLLIKALTQKQDESV